MQGSLLESLERGLHQKATGRYLIWVVFIPEVSRALRIASLWQVPLFPYIPLFWFNPLPFHFPSRPPLVFHSQISVISGRLLQ